MLHRHHPPRQRLADFPGQFPAYWAMNPCPCGFYGGPVKPCTCSSGTVTKYQKRSLLRPHLRPAVGLHRPKRSGNIEVPPVEYDKLSEQRLVEAARGRQRERFAAPVGVNHSLHSDQVNRDSLANASPLQIICNADMGPAEVRQFCPLDDTGRAVMARR